MSGKPAEPDALYHTVDSTDGADALLAVEATETIPVLGQEEVYVYKNISPATVNIKTQSDPYHSILSENNIRISSLLGLDVRTIVIDPGHGGYDSGAVGQKHTLEKDIVLEIALSLQKMLSQVDKYKVLLTRSDDSFVSLSDRVKFANSHNADIFISLHINALPQTSVNLTETFFYGLSDDRRAIQQAKFENQHSGYSIEEYAALLNLLKHRNKEQESNILATQIQNTLFKHLRADNLGIADGGTKVAPFAVLLGVEAPATLVEISCISNEQEELNLQKPLYRQKIASYLKQGILNYLENRFDVNVARPAE